MTRTLIAAGILALGAVIFFACQGTGAEPPLTRAAGPLAFWWARGGADADSDRAVFAEGDYGGGSEGCELSPVGQSRTDADSAKAAEYASVPVCALGGVRRV